MGPYRVLSWGCGAPSTALAVLSALGHIDPLNAILTADTGWERAATYEAAAFYLDWLKNKSPTTHIEMIKAGDIKADAAKSHSHMPFWTQTGGPLKRQCTREYKIRPIRRRIRELLGYDPSKAPAPPVGAVEQWLGFTWEEVGRMREDDRAFINTRYPLIEMRWTRQNCENFLEDLGLPVPVKSACKGCPFRDAGEYLQMRRQDPAEFLEVVDFDELNRRNPLLMRAGVKSDQVFIFKNAITQMPESLATANLEKIAQYQERNGKQLYLDLCDGPCMT